MLKDGEVINKPRISVKAWNVAIMFRHKILNFYFFLEIQIKLWISLVSNKIIWRKIKFLVSITNSLCTKQNLKSTFQKVWQEFFPLRVFHVMWKTSCLTYSTTSFSYKAVLTYEPQFIRCSFSKAYTGLTSILRVKLLFDWFKIMLACVIKKLKGSLFIFYAYKFSQKWKLIGA